MSPPKPQPKTHARALPRLQVPNPCPDVTPYPEHVHVFLAINTPNPLNNQINTPSCIGVGVLEQGNHRMSRTGGTSGPGL